VTIHIPLAGIEDDECQWWRYSVCALLQYWSLVDIRIDEGHVGLEDHPIAVKPLGGGQESIDELLVGVFGDVVAEFLFLLSFKLEKLVKSPSVLVLSEYRSSA